jgi:hypothetical protein
MLRNGWWEQAVDTTNHMTQRQGLPIKTPSSAYGSMLPINDAQGEVMKKLPLALVLAIASSGAMADWIAVSKDDVSTFYVDDSTIQTEGDKAKMWGLFDFKTEQAAGRYRYLSQMTQYEFDCKKKLRRDFYSWFHSMHMGGGDVVYTINRPDDKWSHIVPGSEAGIMWKIACGKN